jgi:aminoglycoside 6'-N-acetyltransferase I
MHIRKAAPADQDEWVRMRRLLGVVEDENRPEVEAYFDGGLYDVMEVLVLDRGDGRLGGLVELNIRNYAEGSRSDRVPYLEGWFVDDDLRGQGYGKRLIQAAENWAREQGLNELASDAEWDNHGSIAAHRALGFEVVDKVLCFYKKLN